MNTLQQLGQFFLEIWNFILDLWDTGNFWARVAIALIAGWFILLVIFAIIPVPLLAQVMALLPIVEALLLLFAAPVIITALAAVPQTRIAIRGVAWILLWQLLNGLYFSLVPVHADRGLVIPLIVAGAALLLLGFAAGITIVTPQRVAAMLVLLIIAFTVIFFFGGRGAVRQQIQQRIAAAPLPPTVSQPPAGQLVWSDTLQPPAQTTFTTVYYRRGEGYIIRASNCSGDPCAWMLSSLQKFPVSPGDSSWNIPGQRSTERWNLQLESAAGTPSVEIWKVR
jgi:hypothetical protein